MKEINNIKYYNISEIIEIFPSSGETEDTIRKHFETGVLKGKKIEEKWYATKEDIADFIGNKGGAKMYFTDPQDIDLTNINLKGTILDIGGGGEGIIGQLKGNNVVSIDLRKSELEEALESGDKESLKIIMDAKDLKFLDNTFDTITAFFSIMYIPKNDHQKIFKEIYRVLKEEGELVIWDPIIPQKKDAKKDLYIILMKVNFNRKKIITGYGTRWDKEQDIDYFIDLANNIRFKIIEQNLKEDYFFLRLRKT